MSNPMVDKIVVKKRPTNIKDPIFRQKKTCCYENERHVWPPRPMGGRGFMIQVCKGRKGERRGVKFEFSLVEADGGTGEIQIYIRIHRVLSEGKKEGGGSRGCNLQKGVL